MDNKEVEKVLEELQEVRPEKLTGEAKRLFEAILIIADSRDKAEADLYEANKRIADLLLILGDRDRMINLMAQAIDNYDSQLEINSYRDKDEIIEAFKEAMARRDFREKKRKEFEKRCKNADKKWEDKIKAKIEEIDKEIEKKREIARNPMDRVSGRLLTDSIVELEKTKKVLQSLLEKE